MAGAIIGAALLQLAVSCGGPDAPVDLLARIVMHESGGDPTVTNGNRNGTTDYGLAQINSSNLGWLGETPVSIMDPCRNIAAEARILRAFSGYATGSLTRGFTLKPPGAQVSYVASMADAKYRPDGVIARAPSAPPPPSGAHVLHASTAHEIAFGR